MLNNLLKHLTFAILYCIFALSIIDDNFFLESTTLLNMTLPPVDYQH